MALMRLRTLENNNVSIIRCDGNMATEEAAIILKNAIYNFPSYDSIVINLVRVDAIGDDALTVIKNAIAEGYRIVLAELQPAVKNALTISNSATTTYLQEETAILELKNLQMAEK